MTLENVWRSNIGIWESSFVVVKMQISNDQILILSSTHTTSGLSLSIAWLAKILLIRVVFV